MLRTTLTALAGFAAFGIITAATANADLTNQEVAGGNTSTPAADPSVIIAPDFTQGVNGPVWRVKLDKNCNPVKGVFTDEGFVEDPNGKPVYTCIGGCGDQKNTLRSSPYKSGLN